LVTLMKKIVVLALVLILGSILVLYFCSLTYKAVLENNQLESEKVFVEPSWAYWYPDFESLMEDFDLVTVGKVVKSQLDPENEEFTLHDFLVLEVIKDSNNEVEREDTITVKQFGGIWTPKGDSTPVQVEFRDSPLMKEGETSLLFLNRRSDGMYAGISPQTRFIVDDDKVYWLGAEYENRDIHISKNLQIEGTELKETISQLRQLQ
jgi:hypothetical protein